MMPITWITGFSTMINLILATGPFSYPYPFVKSGVLLAPLVLIIVMFVSLVTA